MDWLESLIEFFTDKDNIGDIIIIVIALIGLPPTIIGFFKWVRRFLSVCKKKIPTKFKKMKDWLAYRRTIGKLVRLEIRVIPETFLDGKSREKNPELRKIYRMIDEKLLPRPLTKDEGLDKYFKDHPLNLDDLLGPPNLKSVIRRIYKNDTSI